MKHKVKLLFLQSTLLFWFKTYNRNFSWRKTTLTQYEYVIAEILLQRTKAETVEKFYSKFLLQFPNWASLHKVDENELQEILKPIGLYKQRALRIKALAKNIMQLGGQLPSKREDLSNLPMFGQYITNAVRLLIYNEPVPLLDVNMARLLERFFEPRKLADIRFDPFLQKLSYEVVKHKNSIELNWAILDFAALICKPKPLCNSCPINLHCTFYRAQTSEK